MNAYRTFSFTIRPKCGVSDTNISHFIKKFKSSHKNDGHLFYMVSEKEGTERHLHGQIWYEKPVGKDVPTKYLKREFPKLWEAHQYIIKVALDVRVVYNCDWIKHYLDKGGHVCLNLMPEEEMLEGYLPPKEKQEYWMNKKDSTDTQLFDLEIKYKEKYSEVSMPNVSEFLAEAMFGKEKFIRPLRSVKAKRELGNTLYFWLNGVDQECKDSFIDYGDKHECSPGIGAGGHQTNDKKIQILQDKVSSLNDGVEDLITKWWMN